MRSPSIIPLLLCGLLGVEPILAAETGDLNGDGRVDLADVFHYQDELPAAPGAMSRIEEYPCYGWNDGLNVLGALYLEALAGHTGGALSRGAGAGSAGGEEGGAGAASTTNASTGTDSTGASASNATASLGNHTWMPMASR